MGSQTAVATSYATRPNAAVGFAGIASVAGIAEASFAVGCTGFGWR